MGVRERFTKPGERRGSLQGGKPRTRSDRETRIHRGPPWRIVHGVGECLTRSPAWCDAEIEMRQRHCRQRVDRLARDFNRRLE